MRIRHPLFIAVLMAFAGAAWADPVTFTDQRGKGITLPEPARHIVVIPLPMASVVMALDGGAKRLAAIHPQALQSVQEGFLGKVFPGALNLPTNITRGGQFTPNLESILALKPDAVIQWTEPAKILEPLDDAGLNVVGLINSPPTEAINQANMTIVARMIGRNDRLVTILGWHDKAMAAVKAVTDSLPDADRPKVLYLRATANGYRPAGAGVYQDFWLRLAGGRNAAGQFDGMGTQASAEQILAWNPDVVFLSAFDDVTPAQFMKDPLFVGLSAVENERVYKMPHGGYRWDPGSHESHLTMEWAAMMIHPEKFDFNLRADMRESYRFLYNHELTDDEIDQILAFDLNGAMAGYARLAR
jgi:iron complex transport system substrate-binding protein